MIRILAIGRAAQYVSEKLKTYTIKVELAKLPAAGVRAMEDIPPDLVVIHDLQSSPSLWLLVQGIRARPLGKLTPILILAPPPSEANRQVLDHVEGWEEPSLSTTELVEKITSVLGISLKEIEQKIDSVNELRNANSPTQLRNPQHAISNNTYQPKGLVVKGPGYVLEEIIEDSTFGNDANSSTHGLERGRANQPVEEKLNAEHIRFMLRKIRHEDYFTILSVSRRVDNDAVYNAYRYLSERFDPSRVSFELNRGFRDELAEIADALEDAWAVLGDEALRQSYLETTTRKI